MGEELLDRKLPATARRLKYGPGDLHFGDLYLPELGPGRKAPLLMFIHGGWWKNGYGLDYGGHLCEAVRRLGMAAWSIEYRRVGDAGGGWPGTFQDVAMGFDFIKSLAATEPVDLAKVVVAGHSAGGHLAFWLAGRPNIPETSVLHDPVPALALHGVVALAGAIDLRSTFDLAGAFTFAHDRQEIANFMGGTPDQVPERYRSGDPGMLVPIATPQWLVQGSEDDQIPPGVPRRWAENGTRLGDNVTVDLIEGADHFDVVDPQSRAWPQVRAALLAAFA